jgi:hypothetical protein
MDPMGLNGTATITVVVIPLGAARFAGFNSALLPATFPTGGGTLVEILGENLLVGLPVSAVYRNDAMRVSNISAYAAQVSGLPIFMSRNAFRT